MSNTEQRLNALIYSMENFSEILAKEGPYSIGEKSTEWVLGLFLNNLLIAAKKAEVLTPEQIKEIEQDA